MSFLLKEAKFLIKKEKFLEINFTLESQNIITVLYSDNNQIKWFEKILQGYISLNSGNFKIDGFDVVDKEWTKKRVINIKSGRFLQKKLVKILLFWALLLNSNFSSNAKQNYISLKYTYLNFFSTKRDLTDLKIREEVEVITKKFINASIKIEEDWLEEFLKKVTEFNNNKLSINAIKFNKKLEVIIKNYYFLLEKTKNYFIFETFLQSLWDKVYSFLDLVSACNCEFNAKNSKDKLIKKKAKKLKLTQHYYVIIKELKILDVKIRNIKKKITKNNFLLKSIAKQIRIDIFKTKKIKTKTVDDLFEWRQLSLDQRFEFTKKQEKICYETLNDEANIIRGKVIEKIHEYHSKILNDQIAYIDEAKFKEEATAKKMQITTVHNQANLWIQNTINQLGINFSYVKSNLTLSITNQIYFKLLQAIYLKKYNIIFSNILPKLSKSEKIELFDVINKLKDIDNKFTFTFIEQKLQDVYDYNANIYILGKNGLVLKSTEEILKDNWDEFGKTFMKERNKIEYQYEENVLICNNQKLKIKIKNQNYQSNGSIVLNPTKIFFSKKNIKNDYIKIDVNEIKNKKQVHKNLKIFVDNNKNKYIVILNNLINEKITTLYFTEESILKII